MSMISLFLILFCGYALTTETEETKRNKRGIPESAGWIGIPNSHGYGHGQPWIPDHPWKGLKFPPFDLPPGSSHGGPPYGIAPGIPLSAGRTDILKTVPVYITKHVVLEKPVYVEKQNHVPVEKVAPVPMQSIIHRPAADPVPEPEVDPVPVERPIPRPVKHPMPMPVPQPYPVPVNQGFPVPVPVPIKQGFPVPVPVPIKQGFPVPVPVPIKQGIPVPFPVPVPINSGPITIVGPVAYDDRGYGGGHVYPALHGHPFHAHFIHGFDAGFGHNLGHDYGHGHGHGYPPLAYAHDYGHEHGHKEQRKN